MILRILFFTAVSVLAMTATSGTPDTALLQEACGRESGAIEATGQQLTLVSCESHTTLAGLPALFVADCERVSSRWQCARPQLVVRMPVGAGTVLIAPQGTNFDIARDVARVLADHPWHFNGRDLAGMLQGLCSVADMGTGAFAGARDYRLRCGDRGVIVTRACVDSTCRMFPARWDDA